MSREILIHKADLLLALDAEGKPVELHHALRVVREMRTALADYEADAIHTCGPDCKRPLCVLRAELAALHGTLERVRSASRDQRDADAFFLREARAVRLALSEELAASRDEARRLAGELAALRAQEPAFWYIPAEGEDDEDALVLPRRDGGCPSSFATQRAFPLYAAPAPAAVPDDHPTVVDRADGTPGAFCIRRVDRGYAQYWNPKGWSGHGYLFRDRGLADAVCSLLAAPAPAAVPDGYVLVPKEPTREMVAAGVSANDGIVSDIYRAMVSQAVKDSLTTAATAAAPDDVALAYGVLWHANNMRPGYDAPAGHARWTPEKAAYKARHILRDLLTRDQRGDGINRAADLLAAAQEGKP